MIKDIIQKNENITPNGKQLAVIKEHFPACFKADGTFDVERFKAEIANTTNVVQEGYELKFLGKSYAKLLASTETTTVIQPNETHNSLPENAKSENIYISGDNLDGLKHLLKSYNGAIKCIYIDPPYNTGSDGFVYADNFNYTTATLQEKLSVSEEEAERILDLTKRGSASHSAWLMFMYSRLLLARDLLKDDGVIFISIDDNEQANLKLLCDDVFGEENFVANVIWQKSKKGDAKLIATTHEYILFYARSKSAILEKGVWRIKKPGVDEVLDFYTELVAKYQSDHEAISKEMQKWYASLPKSDVRINHKHYKYSDARGLYFADNFAGPDDGRESRPRYEIIHPKTGKPCKKPSTGWRWDEDRTKKALAEEPPLIHFGPDETTIPCRKSYLKFIDSEPASTVFYKDGRTATLSVESLTASGVFSFPKDVDIIAGYLNLIGSSDSIVLDFFSGSASTAHAVLQANLEHCSKLKFISVQLPEQLDPSNSSQKAAYEFLKEKNLPTTLDYIGIERIKRAAAKITEEHPDKKMDLGFKHYILQESNQNTLDKLDSFDKAGMLADTSILDDFGKPTILATWLNADGYGLRVEAEVIDLAGYTAYYCQKHLYLIDPGFTLESMKALLSKYDAEGHFNPENLVLFGYSFPDWSINEMIEKNLRILNDGEKNLKINFTVRY
jgi:adenine-specific DNA-methyltransferase